MNNYAVFGAVIQLKGIAGWRWGSDQMNNYAVFSAVISWKALLNGCVLSLLCAVFCLHCLHCSDWFPGFSSQHSRKVSTEQ